MRAREARADSLVSTAAASEQMVRYLQWLEGVRADLSTWHDVCAAPLPTRSAKNMRIARIPMRGLFLAQLIVAYRLNVEIPARKK
jgi:hypothetical protein